MNSPSEVCVIDAESMCPSVLPSIAFSGPNDHSIEDCLTDFNRAILSVSTVKVAFVFKVSLFPFFTTNVISSEPTQYWFGGEIVATERASLTTVNSTAPSSNQLTLVLVSTE